VTAGYFSPLPPAQSGVADYASDLLQDLRRLGTVVVNGDGDVNLYHLGNNQLHRQIYAKAMQRPGVAVIHDAVLQHFFLGSLNREQYIEEFIYNYGAWTRDIAARLWEQRASSAGNAEYFRYPMLRRIVETSQAVIVHNPGAAEMVRAHWATARVTEIPLMFAGAPSAEPQEVYRARERYGARSHTFLYGIFGHLRESKRILTVLRAFSEARIAAPEIGLLIAGGSIPSDLQRAMAPLLAQPGVVQTGFAPEREFWRNAHAVDACINLRYPPAGESSSITVRLMGIAKPVIVTAGAETSRFPDSACLRVDSGTGEQAMLREFLIWLAQHRPGAREIGRRAMFHIHQHHGRERVALEYWRVLLDERS
jgi:glycosyltransferase involved in cell wall biosynthesis